MNLSQVRDRTIGNVDLSKQSIDSRQRSASRKELTSLVTSIDPEKVSSAIRKVRKDSKHPINMQKSTGRMPRVMVEPLMLESTFNVGRYHQPKHSENINTLSTKSDKYKRKFERKLDFILSSMHAGGMHSNIRSSKVKS